MRLLFARVVAARGLVTAAAAGTLASTVLLTGFLLYAQLLPDAGARTAIIASDPSEHTLLLSGSAGADAATTDRFDRTARDLLGSGLAGTPLEVHAGGHTGGQVLPGLGDVEVTTAFLAELPAHAQLLDGAWPRPVATGEPLQAALPTATAAELGLAVGDDVVVRDARGDTDRAVTVVGLWQPRAPADAYWRLAANPSLTGMLVLDRADFLAHYSRFASLQWLGVPDPARLADAGLAEVVAGYRVLAEQVRDRREDAGPANLRLDSELVVLADQLRAAQVVNRSGLVLPAALVAVVAGYGLFLIGRLLAAHRGGENALLRARGASRRQLFGFALAEAALVAAPAAVVSAPLGSQLVAAADRLAGARGLGLASTDLAPYGWWGHPTAWLVALVAAGGCALALVLPAWRRGRTWVAELAARARRPQALRDLRGGVDIALVVLALLAAAQLHQYELAVAPGAAGIDPLLVIAPVLAVLAGAAVARRLLPLATSAGAWLADRARTFAGIVAMWHADRRPHAGPVLLLVLAVATAVLAPAIATTWQQSQRDQAGQLVGADLRLVGPSSARAQIDDLPGVTGVMGVHRTTVNVPDRGSTPLLAIDSPHAAGIAQVRLEQPRVAAFAELAGSRPQVSGVDLPVGAQRLVGEVRFQPAPSVVVSGSEPVPPGLGGGTYEYEEEVPSPRSGRLVMHLLDEHGLLQVLPLGEPDAQGRLVVDQPLPAGAVRLAGLDARLNVSALRQLCPPEWYCPGSWNHIPLDPMPVAWELDLWLADGAGTRHRLPLAEGWDAQVEEVPFAPQVSRRDAVVTVTVEPARHAATVWQVWLGEPLPEVLRIPAVVTPDVLAASGGQVGRAVDIGGLPLRVVGTAATIPGVPGGSGVLIDLGHMAVQQAGGGNRTPAANEWWAASLDPPAAAAEAGRRGLVATDRVTAQDRLLADPLGAGLLVALLAAAVGAAVLAAVGMAVDARATSVARHRDLAVLNMLGASRPLLGRALVVEQAVLAGLGVIVGLVVGLAVAATTGRLLILTPAGQVPVPAPVLAVSIGQVVIPALGLLALALVLAVLVSRRARRELAARALRFAD